MDIIFRGTIPSEQTFTGTCGNCKTVVKFTKSEGKVTSYDQRDGDFISVTCPVCGEKIYTDY